MIFNESINLLILNSLSFNIGGIKDASLKKIIENSKTKRSWSHFMSENILFVV